MLRDKMESGINSTTKIVTGVLALFLVLGIPLVVLYAAVRVIKLAWGS